jgi:hypothetical protein
MGALYFVPPRDFGITVTGRDIELEAEGEADNLSASPGKTRHPIGEPVSAELPPTKLPKLPDPIFTTVAAPVAPKPVGSKVFKDIDELLKNLQIRDASPFQSLILHVDGAVDVQRLIAVADQMDPSVSITVHLVTSE